MKNITTGIDKLVQLVNTVKKITADDAAKELNLGKDVVEEWAELLEQDGVISISYKLSKMYIEEKQISESDVTDAANTVLSQKDAFKRKVESTIKALNKDTAGFETIRKEFIKINSHLKDELEEVRKEMNELEHYNQLKKNIDKEIEKQKIDYKKFIDSYAEELDAFDKRYKSSVSNLKIEESNLQTLQRKIETMKLHKTEIERTIQSSLLQLKTISKHLDMNLKQVHDSETKIKKLQHTIGDLSKGIATHKEQFMKELAKKIGVKQEEIERQQDSLLRNAKAKVETIRDYAASGKKIFDGFDDLIKRRIKTVDLIDSIEKEKDDLVKELEKLGEKVDSFKVKANHPDMKKHLKSIDEEITRLTKRKDSLIGKIENLMKYIKS